MPRTLLQATAVPPQPAGETLRALQDVRRDTLALIAHLDDATLERAHSPIMSPLVWDLAHIAAYEDLWLAHRHAGLPLLRPELAELYDAFETPRAVRGELEQLDAVQARAYLRAVRARVADAIQAEGVGDGVLHELVLRHECQHTETMRQTMALAGILPPGEPRLHPVTASAASAPGDPHKGTSQDPDASPPHYTGTGAADDLDTDTGAGGDLGLSASWLELAAGSFAMGAVAEGFAYDNERPRHRVETPAFRIARRPVTNAEWLHFSERGGYGRREWWSPTGWAWREEHDIAPHPSVAVGHPHAPVCHISWFEAEAFARAQGARLPTEAEWERAAGTRREELAGVGQVWEWTSTAFHGYPGFVAHPYREYSEVFFGADYRVLRGGSWATSPRVASPTFRNWDYPQRRQIFAGLRLARGGSL